MKYFEILLALLWGSIITSVLVKFERNLKMYTATKYSVQVNNQLSFVILTKLNIQWDHL